MTDIFKGVAAGLVATGLLTGILIVQRTLGLVPQLDLIGLLNDWLAKMVFLMPAANAGLFGLRLGPAAPILMLMMNVAYGATLGWLYGGPMPTPSLEARSHHRAA